MEPGRARSRRADRERSFERLYRRHRADVYRALLRELGNREDAEDVMQTAFLDAYRALSRGGRPERPRAWLLTIAENARRRRYRALRRGPQEASLAREPTAADAEVTVRELRDALERLPPNQRAALVLREVAGLSYAEIASRLDRSVAAVQMLLFRARRALRAELESGVPRGRAAGALGWPWLAQTLASPGSPAGLLPRAAGIVAAGAAGAAVVAGTASLPGALARDDPPQRAWTKPAAADQRPLARPETPGPRRAAPRPEPAAARGRTVVQERPVPRRRSQSAPARPPASAPRPAPAPAGPPPAAAPPPPVIPALPVPLVPDPLTPPLVAAAPPAPSLPGSPPVVPALPEPELPASIAGELPVPAPPAGTGQDGGAAILGLPPS